MSSLITRTRQKALQQVQRSTRSGTPYANRTIAANTEKTKCGILSSEARVNTLDTKVNVTQKSIKKLCPVFELFTS